MSGLIAPAGALIFNNTYPKARLMRRSGNCFIHKGSPWTNEDQHLLHSSVAPLQLLGCAKNKEGSGYQTLFSFNLKLQFSNDEDSQLMSVIGNL